MSLPLRPPPRVNNLIVTVVALVVSTADAAFTMGRKKAAGSFERPFASGDDWRAAVYGTKAANPSSPPPRRPRSAFAGILALAASPPGAGTLDGAAGLPHRGRMTPVVVQVNDPATIPEVKAPTIPVATAQNKPETRRLKSRKKRKAKNPEQQLETAAVATPLPQPAAKPVASWLSELAEEMPSWLRDAADALPSSDRHDARRPAAQPDADSPTPVDWTALSRLLEEKTALEEALMAAQEQRASDVALLEQVEAERDAEAAAARAMRAERASLTVQLEVVKEEKAAVARAELAAQVKLCHKIQDEDALRAVLQHERLEARRARDAHQTELSHAAADAAASAAQEGAATSSFLTCENETLIHELKRTRIALAAGGGRPTTLAAVALQQCGVLPAPAKPPASIEVATGKALDEPAVPTRALLKAKTPKRGLTSRSVNTPGAATPAGPTPSRTPLKPTGLCDAPKSGGGSSRVVEEVMRLEAALLDKENELTRVCSPEDRAVVWRMMA